MNRNENRLDDGFGAQDASSREPTACASGRTNASAATWARP